MIAEPHRSQLTLLATRHGFRGLETLEIQSLAHALLTDGIYHDDLLAIVDSEPAVRETVIPLFESFLSSRDIAVPDRETVLWVLLRHHSSRIIRRDADPLVALGELIAEVYWEYDFHIGTNRYLGDSHGIQRLIGLYWSDDDLQDRPHEVSCNGKYGADAIVELKKEIVGAARHWDSQFGGEKI